jgi:hypothetical protein
MIPDHTVLDVIGKIMLLTTSLSNGLINIWIEVEMKDKIIKGLIRGTCLSVFYLIFEHISRNWGLAETRQFLYILIMILYLWKDN